MQVRVRDIVKIMEEHFPPRLAESWDNSGLQVGSVNEPANRVVVSLDLDKEVLDRAVDEDADMIITHHPFLFKGIKSINYEENTGSLIRTLIKENISLYSAHTNLDSGERGLNQILAERIGLQDIKTLDKSSVDKLYKLVVYVPSGYEQEVRKAINNAGAGYIGNYSDCSFRTKGTGTFTPSDESNPFIGKHGQMEEVTEYRLETVVPQDKLDKVISAMLKAHPYEELAYDIFLMERQGTVYSPGRTGYLTENLSLEQFGQYIKKCLGLEHLRIAGDMDRKVKKIAVVSGAGSSFMWKAKAKNCDVLLTGDLKYHEAMEARAMGIAVVDAGHQGTEDLVVSYLVDLLSKACTASNLDTKMIPVFGKQCIIDI